MANSNIYGVNGIYTADAADNPAEGINFWRSSTTVDSIHAKNGVLYFTPNRTLGTNGTSYVVLHQNNLKDYDYEAYLKWGGQNFVASYGVVDACMISTLGANRLELLRASQTVSGTTYTGIEVAYSRNAGSSWTDYGLTDAQKTNFFNSSIFCFLCAKT